MKVGWSRGCRSLTSKQKYKSVITCDYWIVETWWNPHFRFNFLDSVFPQQDDLNRGWRLTLQVESSSIVFTLPHCCVGKEQDAPPDSSGWFYSRPHAQQKSVRSSPKLAVDYCWLLTCMITYLTYLEKYLISEEICRLNGARNAFCSQIGAGPRWATATGRAFTGHSAGSSSHVKQMSHVKKMVIIRYDQIWYNCY